MTTLTNEAARHATSGRVSLAAAFAVEFSSDWNSLASDWDGAYRRGQATIFNTAVGSPPGTPLLRISLVSSRFW